MVTIGEGELAARCRELSKTYGEGRQAVHALRSIDLEIAYGELHMLVGPSGCGKTTLISILAGILERSGGHCEVLGLDPASLRGARRTAWRGLNIGFVFQQFNLIPTINLRDNVAVPLLLRGENRREALKRAQETLERVGLGDRVENRPSQLSGGQQQRVAIARALVHGPRFVVCDEPTSALDAETGLKVMELLREAAVQSDRALVIVTHDARIFHLADRITELNDGLVARSEAGPAAIAAHANAAPTSSVEESR